MPGQCTLRPIAPTSSLFIAFAIRHIHRAISPCVVPTLGLPRQTMQEGVAPSIIFSCCARTRRSRTAPSVSWKATYIICFSMILSSPLALHCHPLAFLLPLLGLDSPPLKHPSENGLPLWLLHSCELHQELRSGSNPPSTPHDRAGTSGQAEFAPRAQIPS